MTTKSSRRKYNADEMDQTDRIDQAGYPDPLHLPGEIPWPKLN
jgi:hypothetical protein